MASPAGEDRPSLPQAARTPLSPGGGAPLPIPHGDSDAGRRKIRVPAASTRPRTFRVRRNRTLPDAELLGWRFPILHILHVQCLARTF